MKDLAKILGTVFGSLFAFIVAVTLLALAVDAIVKPACAGPDRAKCHSHSTHTHCH